MKIKNFLLSRWIAFCCGLLSVTFSVHAEEPRCVLKGTLMFDPRWVKQINGWVKRTNDQMTTGKSADVQWQSVEILSVTEPAQVVYSGDVASVFLTGGSINIPETIVECDKQYTMHFGYQIYMIGRNGASADIYFTARPDSKPMTLTYPTDFLRGLCSWLSLDCMPQLKTPPQTISSANPFFF